MRLNPPSGLESKSELPEFDSELESAWSMDLGSLTECLSSEVESGALSSE